MPDLPKEKWLRAFAVAVNTAIDKGYFEDILNYDLYPNVDSSDDQIWEKMWNHMDDAFQEIFGVSRDECETI